MTPKKRLALRAATFSLVTATVAHMGFYTVLGSGGCMVMFTPGPVLQLLLPGVIPSMAVALWLFYSRTAAFGIALGIVGAIFAAEMAIFLVWILSITNPIDQSYASVMLLPIIGSALLGLLSYGYALHWPAWPEL